MHEDQIRRTIEDVLQPQHFCIDPTCRFRIEPQVSERIFWEIFHGHLLDGSQTRQQRSFVAWNVWLPQPDMPDDAPLLSIKWAADEGRIYVTRQIALHGWEAYEAEPNVILSREAVRWLSELVGTVHLARVPSPEVLRRQLAHCVFLAVTGASRLPITSLESPLPAFTLGRLGYFYSDTSVESVSPLKDAEIWLDRGLSAEWPRLYRAKLLELVLRNVSREGVSQVAGAIQRRLEAAGLSMAEVPGLVRTIFHHVALSPDTGLVENLVMFLRELAVPGRLEVPAAIDIVSDLLRHLARHLTAFDLVVFHHRGANYPDALFLDSLLRASIAWIGQQPAEFLDGPGDDASRHKQKRLRRRAIRQAWIIRKHYEGYRVPDVPTSPGENQWVWPEAFPRVPEDQITRPAARHRRLYADCTAEELLNQHAQQVLGSSIADLDNPVELLELGMGVFLDRPLGVAKSPGEVDRTPLLSYEAFSRTVAGRRLEDLCNWGFLEAGRRQRLQSQLGGQPVRFGIAAHQYSQPERPGVVALEDARKGVSDFRFLRTTTSSLRSLLQQYDMKLLEERAACIARWLSNAREVLLIRDPSREEPVLVGFDSKGRRRVEFGLEGSDGGPVRYVELAGSEYLEEGLRLLLVWPEPSGDSEGQEQDFRSEQLSLPPRFFGETFS